MLGADLGTLGAVFCFSVAKGPSTTTLPGFRIGSYKTRGQVIKAQTPLRPKQENLVSDRDRKLKFSVSDTHQCFPEYGTPACLSSQITCEDSRKPLSHGLQMAGS